MLRSKGLTLQASYTCQDVAGLFGVTARTIQNKVKDGTLPSRKLIGGGRFLPIDLEHYLKEAAEQRPETVRKDSSGFAR
jgi:helix-turn-helix protein